MRVEVVSSGTEILRGRSIDTNFPFLARTFTKLGYQVRTHAAYIDDIEDLTQGIHAALERADIVVMTGGLGPTVDDLTREAICTVTRRALEFHPEEFAKIRERFRRHRVKMPKINRKQAFLPAGATVIPNPIGSAPGFMVEHRGKLFFALPGVPREMTEMLPWIVETLHRRFGNQVRHCERSFKIFGYPESKVETMIFPKLRHIRDLVYGITAKAGTISLNFKVPDAKTMDRLAHLVRKTFDTAFFGEDDATIESVIGTLLIARAQTLAVAESCTGGLIADKLTDIPGISACLLETLVTYSNASKMQRLNVPAKLIERHGAVSNQVAQAMAEGARKTANADYGLATTGIAGPGGATPAKPAGLVFIALADRKRTLVKERLFGGTRRDVKERASDYALNLLRLALLNV